MPGHGGLNASDTTCLWTVRHFDVSIFSIQYPTLMHTCDVIACLRARVESVVSHADALEQVVFQALLGIQTRRQEKR